MNERIKELAEQATKIAVEEYNSQTMQTFLTNKSDRELFIEKFAELIVHECVWEIVKDDEIPQDIQVLIGNRLKSILEK